MDWATSEAVVVAIVGVLAAPFAAAVSWVLSRRRRILDNTSVLIHASGDAVEALHEAMAALRVENAELKGAIADLKQQNALLMEENRKLSGEITELRDALDDIKGRWWIEPVKKGDV